MTPEQNHRRNEAHHLLRIAKRILSDAGLSAYADEVSGVLAGMETDAKMQREQFLNNRIGVAK